MIARWWENFCFWLAYNVIPRTLITTCFIRVFAYATTEKYGRTDCTKITAADVLQRWYTDCDLCPVCQSNVQINSDCSVCYLHTAEVAPPFPISGYDAHGDFNR